MRGERKTIHMAGEHTSADAQVIGWDVGQARGDYHTVTWQSIPSVWWRCATNARTVAAGRRWRGSGSIGMLGVITAAITSRGGASGVGGRGGGWWRWQAVTLLFATRGGGVVTVWRGHSSKHKRETQQQQGGGRLVGYAIAWVVMACAMPGWGRNVCVSCTTGEQSWPVSQFCGVCQYSCGCATTSKLQKPHTV